MTTGTVNTLIARCMVDPEFLALLSSDRDAALRGYELDDRTRSDFAALDIRRVIGLATVITKVQNNGLWQWIPNTRALTVRYGLEQELFAAFHRDHQALRAGPRTRDEQTRRFFDFLGHALAEWIPEETPALRDVFQHERLLWELRTIVAGGTDTPCGTDTPVCAPGAPAPNGGLRAGFFSSSPHETIAAIREERFIPANVRSAPQWLVYHADIAAQTGRTLEVDEMTGRVLALADGTRSVAAIARESGIDRRRVKRLIDAAADAGLLTIPVRRSH
jgi:hypothetical protein